MTTPSIAPHESDPVTTAPDALSASEQQQRAAAYALLAALLRSPPDAALLAQVATLSDDAPADDELALATAMLGLAARSSEAERIGEEFQALFVGIGRGELLPYGSWYLTGFLMEQPLSLLRDDLARLGFERDPQVCEPEDHIAALCEVLSMLIQEQRPYALQSRFFDSHLAPWGERFFADLSGAGSAVFYRNLGRFGTAFMQFERRYFELQV